MKTIFLSIGASEAATLPATEQTTEHLIITVVSIIVTLVIRYIEKKKKQ